MWSDKLAKTNCRNWRGVTLIVSKMESKNMVNLKKQTSILLIIVVNPLPFLKIMANLKKQISILLIIVVNPLPFSMQSPISILWKRSESRICPRSFVFLILAERPRKVSGHLYSITFGVHCKADFALVRCFVDGQTGEKNQCCFSW